MGRIGFWQLLLDERVSYWEGRAINGAYDQAQLAAAQADNAQFGVDQLRDRVQQMSREIIMLRCAVTVLVNTLRDTNVIDPQLLDARLEAALDEALAPPPQPAPAGAMPPLTCIRCREAKPAAATTMTADGPVCDGCLR